MKHPNPLMLVRLAQGDAYGMATEYIKLPRDQATLDKALQFTSYVRHPTHNLRAGQYTDDTQMSVAVTEVLLEGTYSREAFADAFVRCFKRDRRDGYARHFQEFLESVETGQDFLQNIYATSDKNGACMRAVPIGVLPNPALVEFVAVEQARLTHDTPGGKHSAAIIALMSHFAHHLDGSLDSLQAYLCNHFHVMTTEIPLWEGGPVVGPGVGMATARAVMTLLMTETTLMGIARRAIEWGGDTDSVLALVWGIASARIHDELPPFFDGGLENGPYGRTFLAELGGKLMQKFVVTP